MLNAIFADMQNQGIGMCKLKHVELTMTIYVYRFLRNTKCLFFV